MTRRVPKIVVVTVGIAYTLTSLIILAAPHWFFNQVGHFPPFNRHYMADAAVFSLGLGLALLWAAKDLARRRGLIGIAALVSSLHLVNHGLDAVGTTPGHWLTDVGPLVLLTVGLIFTWGQVKSQK